MHSRGESDGQDVPGTHPAVVLTARVLLAFLIVASLKSGQTFLLPITISILISFFLTPTAIKLERRGVPRYPTAVFSVLCLLGFAVAFSWFVAAQAASVVEESPQFRANLSKRYAKAVEHFNQSFLQIKHSLDVTPVTSPYSSKSNILTEHVSTDKSVAIDPVAAAAISPVAILSSLGLALMEVFVGIVIVAVLSVFLLAHREEAYDRLLGLAGESRLLLTTRVLGDVVNGVRRYLLLNLSVNIIFSIGFAVLLALLGVPEPVLWASVAVLLRFIPHIGVYLAIIPPLLCTLALTSGWSAPVLLIAGGVGFDAIVSNFVEPRIYGRGIGVSSIAIVISALFWIWCWGLLGLVVATPFTVCLAVLGRYVPGLESFSILFGEDTGLRPAYKFYHRLVASDIIDAENYIKHFRAEFPASNIDDELIMPAALFAETDFQSMLLSKATYAGILEMLEKVARDTDDDKEDIETQALPDALPVTLIPLKSESEGLLAKVLEYRLKKQGYLVERLSESAFAGEALELIKKEGRGTIVLLSITPRSAPSLTYLLKRLSGAGVRNQVLVVAPLLDGQRARALRAGFPLPVTVATSVAELERELSSTSHIEQQKLAA